MNVGQLRELLLTYDQDSEVLTTWEGTLHLVYPENVYQSTDGVVVINADGNWNKELDEKSPLKDYVARLLDEEKERKEDEEEDL